VASRSVDFGYCPPPGDRGWERVSRDTFTHDLHAVLDVASRHFSSVWISDHLMAGPRFRFECWTQLTWLAARYPDVTVGTLVMANSYRNPALLAKMAATLQELTNNRLVLGYGSGWQEAEYSAFGYGYPSADVRIAQMVEGIQSMRALWTQEPANYNGAYYQLQNAYCVPRPTRPPPIMIGGGGEKLLLRAVAQHGDWWNTVALAPEILRHKLQVLRRHCEAVDRDYDGIKKTCMMCVYVAPTSRAAKVRASQSTDWTENVFVGDAEQLRNRLHELAELGFDLFQLAFPDFPDTDDMQLFVDEVLPAFRETASAEKGGST
jgi:alkanesulfonate monooxygenase SsuD/methylene tetrahydromethanopterin reductase-like flavin-dependent oxidoreductase (luciferase family)